MQSILDCEEWSTFFKWWSFLKFSSMLLFPIQKFVTLMSLMAYRYLAEWQLVREVCWSICDFFDISVNSNKKKKEKTEINFKTS